MTMPHLKAAALGFALVGTGCASTGDTRGKTTQTSAQATTIDARTSDGESITQPILADGPDDSLAQTPGVAPWAAITISRKSLNTILDQGAGRFLVQIDVQPAFNRGRFQGWEIVSLPADAGYGDVDLRPGDVLLTVNGSPLARPEQLFKAWESLRTADHLSVSYLRGGVRRELRFPIVP